MRLPLIAVVLLFVFSFLIDWYIYSDVRRYSRRGSVWPRVYAVTSVICWLLLIAVVCFPKRSEEDGILALMWMLYSYVTVYVAKFVYVLCSLIGRIFGRRKGKTGKPSRLTVATWTGIVLSLFVFGVAWWGVLVTRRQVEVTEVEVASAKLPAEFDGYRIVQFSDAHVGTWGEDTTFVSHLVDKINEQKADLIVFTGDIVNRETSELDPFVKVLSRLSAPDGVISILGNHDYGDYVDWAYPEKREANNRRLADLEKKMGWNLLNNTHTFIRHGGDSIAVIGVENWGEPPFHQYGDLEASYPHPGDSLGSLNDGRYKLLLSHNPEHWNQIVSHDTNIDLTLSGHTHAMQFMIRLGSWKWSPASYRYEQWGGLYERLNRNNEPVSIYVNIGSGEVAMPYRIGATPEITVITLRHAEENAR